MRIRRSNLQLWSALAVGLVLAGTGAGARTQAQTRAEAAVPVSDVADDTPDFLEFLGSPEADSDLWKAFLKIVPDQLEEIVPVSAEIPGAKGVNE